MDYNPPVVDIRQTATFAAWFGRLKDGEAKARILARVRRVSLGHLGDARSVGDGVSELRFHFGPGYRVYFARRGNALIILLAGGDKGTQERDIEQAKRLAQAL